MQKISRIGRLGFLILIFLFQLSLQAQNKKYFVITGQIVPEEKEASNGVIEITKNGKETSNVEIPKNGRFRLELEFFNEYSLNFKYPGHFNKIIIISTDIPQEVWARDNDFPPFPMVVQLLKEFEGVDKSFTLKPTGRIFYGKDIDNFQKEGYITDIQFVEQIETAKSKANQVQKESDQISKENAQDLAAKQKNFDLLIKEADANYQRGEYQMALAKYLDAQKLFPDKKYPNDRVAELQDLVKALEITERQKAELDQKYKAAIAKANGFFDQKSYRDARPVYVEALQYKPGDVYSNGRITEIDQLLALLEKQKQYKDLVAQADNKYQSKNYDQAIALYNQAKLAVPEEQYPQNQINQINQDKQQQANLEQLDKDFNQAIQAANTFVQQKDYLQALNSYKKALGLKPDNKLAKDKIAETEQSIVAVETDNKYQQAIKLADQALAINDLGQAKIQYREALKLKSGESYPKNKLAEITKTEAEEIRFNELVTNAEKAYTKNSFDESYNLFTQALELKPKNASVQKRIDDIQNLRKQQSADKEYSDLIAQADQSFRNDQLDASLSTFNKALQIKKTETYPIDQIRRIETYQSLIKKADKLFGSKDYPGSIVSFKEAIVQKPNDSYALGKLTEIEKILKEQKQLEEQQKNELTAYNDAIKNADQLFTAQNYTEALNKYKEAAGIKTAETYPKKRIKEVENILDGLEKEEARIEKDYLVLIAQADKLLEKKDYTNSQADYQKALVLKPAEAYPKEQILKIDQTLAENRKLEDEKLRLQKEKQDAETKTQQEFNLALANGEALLKSKELTKAKDAFTKANNLIPSETVPPKRIAEINALLDLQARKDAGLKATLEAYQSVIQKADKQFGNKEYDSARLAYNEALLIEPDEKYPLDQLALIEKMLKDQIEQNYKIAIAKADIAFTSNQFDEAVTAYQSAMTYKKNDMYATKRLKEIDQKKADIKADNIRLKKLQDQYNSTIADADKDFMNKEYQKSKEKYQKATALKPAEAYPKEQILKIDQTLAENRKLEDEKLRSQKEKLDLAFNQAMTGADKSFTENDFEAAKTGYQTALSIKPNDPVAKEKFGQAEAKLAQLAKMTLAYNTAISNANRQLTDKRYKEAKAKYQEALQYLPESEYPNLQIAKIDEVLGKQEAEAKTQEEFDLALADGETLLKSKELTKAKDAFMKAYNLIPSETVPPKRIAEINALLELQTRKDSELKANLAAYQEAVQRADKHFDNKEYNSAQLIYNEALLIKPDEKYPVVQLALIGKLIIDQNEQNYKTAIAKADIAFTSNQFDEAATAYQSAMTYKKNDPYAIKRLKEIDQKKVDIEADNIRLKKLQDQYNSTIADADKDFMNNEYQKSKEKYQKALTLKPEEVLPKEQIAKIDQILSDLQKEEETNRQYAQVIKTAQEAFRTNKLKEARDAYQKASDLKPLEPMPPMKISEIDKMLGQLDETAKLAAQEKAQRQAKEKADRDQYEKAIAAGDQSFAEKQYLIARTHYNTALTVLTTEKYPKDQIARIDELLSQAEKDKALSNQKAQQDSMQKAKDRLFDQAMAAAKEHEQNQRYEQAIQKYTNAIQIKPDQRTLIQKLISDIQEKMQLLAKKEAEYRRIIKLADNLFTGSKLNEALNEYRNALTIKSDEDYPKKQIEEIQSQLKIREENYSNAIKIADKAFDVADWGNAKTGYTDALGIKPKESYPATRLKEVNRKISDANMALISKSAENKAFRDAMEKAEKSFQDDKLTTARMQFQVAQTLKPDEKLPAERIKEIDDLIDKRNKDRLAQTQREIDEKFRLAVSVADNSFREKTYAIAKLQYKQALIIKPDESYPKNQMDLIDKLLSEAKPVETYAIKLPETEPAMTVGKPIYNPVESAQATEARAQSFDPVVDYNEAVKKADDSFGIKDYTVARFFYLKASDIKPKEEYPKTRIELIRKLIDSQLSSNDVSEYENSITQADAAFAKENFSISKFFYYKALGIKSWEKYPKDRINEILALTHSLLSEKEEKEYREIIAKADEAYFNKDIGIARFYYNKAISIKKDENYPRIKLKDIEKLIEQDKGDQENLEYRKLIEEGDQAFKLENFSIARFSYNRALVMKPDEKYPKDQLKLLKEALVKKSN